MKKSLGNSMKFLPSAFFASNQYISPGDIFNGLISDEKEDLWNIAFYSNILSHEDYFFLLKMPEWDLAYLPFFVAGIRIFRIRFHKDSKCGAQPAPGEVVINIHLRVTEAIRSRKLRVEVAKDKVELPLHEAICPPEDIFLEDMLSNEAKYPIKVQISRLINWAIFADIQLPEQLLELLDIYQQRPKFRVEEYRNKGTKHLILDLPQLIKKTEFDEIKLLAAAQALWFIKPGISKSKLIKDPLFIKYGLSKEYTHTSKHLYSKIRAIDPQGTNRKRGRPYKNAIVAPFPVDSHIPIPGVFSEDNGGRIDLERARAAFTVFFKMLHDSDFIVGSNAFWDHPLLQFYLLKSHPLITKISSHWLEELSFHNN